MKIKFDMWLLNGYEHDNKKVLYLDAIIQSKLSPDYNDNILVFFHENCVTVHVKLNDQFFYSFLHTDKPKKIRKIAEYYYEQVNGNLQKMSF